MALAFTKHLDADLVVLSGCDAARALREAGYRVRYRSHFNTVLFPLIAAALLERFGPDGFAVFPASESLLSRGLALGAGGCISATVNLNPHGIRALFDGWDGPQGAALRAQADAVRQAVQALPMIAAMKQVLARARADSDWERLCPPLVPLEPARTAALLQALRAQGFAMPGLGALA